MTNLRGVGVAGDIGARGDDDDSLVAVGHAFDHADARPRLVADGLHYRAGLADHAAHLQGTALPLWSQVDFIVRNRARDSAMRLPDWSRCPHAACSAPSGMHSGGLLVRAADLQRSRGCQL